MAEAGNTLTFTQQDLMIRSFSMFCDMKNRGELSDVSIRIDQRVFTAHRIILAAVIPYFRTMFTSNLAESKAKEVTMKDLDPDALQSLIDFAYTSRVTITAENVQSLLVVSDLLQLTQVRDSCCEFMSKRLHLSNVVQVRILADSLNCSNLVANSDSYIGRNFDSFCQSGDFLNLSFSFLKDLIKRDDLRVKSEEKVFDAVLTWVKKDTGRNKLLPELLTEIRLMMLSPQFLIKRASTEKLIQESIPCRNLLDEAKHYHLLPDERLLCSFALSERCYTEQDNIYLFCRNNSGGLTVFKYSAETQKLSMLLNDRARIDVQRVVALGNAIYVFRSNSFELFNPVSLQWTPLSKFGSRNEPFKYIVPFENKIFWLESNSYGNSSKVFDPVLNKWAALNRSLQLNRAAEVVSTETFIYILSYGHDVYSDSIGQICLIYHPQTGIVKKIADKNGVSSFFACASLDKNVYVCGGIGYHELHELKSGEMYNPSVGKWVPISPMKTARKNFSLVSSNKKLFAFGGTMSNGMHVNSIECYDPKTDKWTTAGEIGGNYSFLCAVATSAAGNGKGS